MSDLARADRMAVRLVLHRAVPDGQDIRAHLLDREIATSGDPLATLADSLIDIAVNALCKWAESSGSTIEECLADLLDEGLPPGE